MKKTILAGITSLILAVALLSGCAGFDLSKVTPYAGDSAFAVTSAFLVVSKNPAQDGATLQRVASKISALATGTVISPEQFSAAVASVVPSEPKWTALVGALTRVYRRAQPLIKADYSAYLKFINETSTGVLDATAGYASISLDMIKTDGYVKYSGAPTQERGAWFVEMVDSLDRDDMQRVAANL